MKRLIDVIRAKFKASVPFCKLLFRRLLDYAGFILAIIAGARHVHGSVIIALALGITLLFARSRRNIDKARRSALPPNPFFDGLYFFAANLLIVFVCYILGYFATSGGGEMFGMWIQEEVLRRPRTP